MMGVYLPNMEMPTSCGDCKAFVCYRQWAGDAGDCFCGITKSDAIVGARNADCPLVPVPPHGIDYDRLLKVAKKMHTWIFLNTGDEQAAYDECGLTDEENALLGYGGQFELRADPAEEGEG